MPKSEATIRDIARILGISKSTVSRALNNHYDVSSETALKVRELAVKMDYQPNLLAQHLKQQRTNTIGVLIPETVNRFTARAVGGIQQVADHAGYNVMRMACSCAFQSFGSLHRLWLVFSSRSSGRCTPSGISSGARYR